MLRLITRDERLSIDISGATFFYRRIPNKKRGEILKRHTKRGELNILAAGVEMLEYCILGWKNVTLDGTTEAQFDMSLVAYIPSDAQDILFDAIGANLDGSEGAERRSEELKNSSTSFDSSTQTAD